MRALVVGVTLLPRAHGRRSAHGRLAWVAPKRLGWSLPRGACGGDILTGRVRSSEAWAPGGSHEAGCVPRRPTGTTTHQRPPPVPCGRCERSAARSGGIQRLGRSANCSSACVWALPSLGPADQPRAACTRCPTCRRLYRVSAWRPERPLGTARAGPGFRRQQRQKQCAAGTRGCRTHRCVAPSCAARCGRLGRGAGGRACRRRATAPGSGLCVDSTTLHQRQKPPRLTERTPSPPGARP